MKLVIDCFKLVKGTGKSIGIYNLTKNLVWNLAKTKNKKDKIVILGTKYNQEDFDIPGVKFVAVKYNPKNKLVCIFWELYLVNVALKQLKADAVLFPRGFAPMKKICPEYVIIHDMIPFYYHENYPGVLNRVENFYIMWRLKASAKVCDMVLTDSNASKKEIVDITGVNPWKVEVVYPGCNKIRGKEEKSETFEVRLTEVACEGKKYISAITSGLPHKNAKGIIESYRKYYERAKKPLPMAIIGLGDVEEYDLPKEIKENIVCYKFLEKDEDMYDIIRNSKMFLFLSKIEGFGFPPLEAMQLGVPVVCSNISSVPEVTGEAAMLVNPEDTDAVAETLMKLNTDEKLCERYVEKGFENVSRFEWKYCIEKYKKVILGE